MWKISVEIHCFVVNPRLTQCFLALNACAACATVHLSALIARPCLTVVDAEHLATTGDVGLGDIGVWRNDLHVVVCALLCSLTDGVDERGTAVGIDGVPRETS